LCAHNTKMGAISALENTAGVVCGAVGIQRLDFSEFRTPLPLPHPVPPPRKSGTLYPSASQPLVELAGVTTDVHPATEVEDKRISSDGYLAPPIADVSGRHKRIVIDKIRAGEGHHEVTWNDLARMHEPANNWNPERESSPTPGWSSTMGSTRKLTTTGSSTLIS
ncbi:hypothetical protein H0H93_012426, partial [Arthromyces matolae]